MCYLHDYGHLGETVMDSILSRGIRGFNGSHGSHGSHGEKTSPKQSLHHAHHNKQVIMFRNQNQRGLTR